MKWPNDVQVEGRKLAGVLIEARPQDGWGVVGVGLNLTIASGEFPPELRESAISLFADSRSRVAEPPRCSPCPSRPLLAEALSRHLAEWIEADDEARC